MQTPIPKVRSSCWFFLNRCLLFPDVAVSFLSKKWICSSQKIRSRNDVNTEKTCRSVQRAGVCQMRNHVCKICTHMHTHAHTHTSRTLRTLSAAQVGAERQVCGRTACLFISNPTFTESSYHLFPTAFYLKFTHSSRSAVHTPRRCPTALVGPWHGCVLTYSILCRTVAESKF